MSCTHVYKKSEIRNSNFKNIKKISPKLDRKTIAKSLFFQYHSYTKKNASSLYHYTQYICIVKFTMIANNSEKNILASF